MSAKERLQQLQAALEERGVQDVKFFVLKNANVSLSHVASDAADFLDAVIKGRVVPARPLGDSVRHLKA